MQGKVLAKGDRVTLVGLKSTGMNGKKGTIVYLPGAHSSKEENRYGVWVDGCDKAMSIKSINIRPERLEASDPFNATREESHQTEASSSLATKNQAFQKGDRVALFGLKTSKLNGRRGKIVSLSDPTNENRYGVKVDGRKKAMRIKPANMRQIAKTTQELKQEYKELKGRGEFTNEECPSADEMEMTRRMMSMILTEKNATALFGRKIEPLQNFRVELIKEGGGFPKAIDHKWANEYLRQVYESECMLPHMFELHLQRPDYAPHPKELMKRLMTNHPSKLFWYLSSQPGDIFEECLSLEHANCLRYSYSNQQPPQNSDVLIDGKTHVAIGFVDLGFLMASDSLEFRTSPLRYIGIDSSAYVVAKTSLIWELIQYAGSAASTEERDLYKWYIIQVWFSTTWSEGTEPAVKAALSSLLSLPARHFDSEVRSILQHWHRASPLPLKEARLKIQSFKTDAGASIGLLKKKQDRIAMAKYQLTGDFGVTNPVCGSIVYLDCPDGTPPPPSNETVFSALDFEKVMELAKKDSRMTILDAAEKYACERVAKLVSWCSRKLITVELRCTKVQDAIDYIASQRPRSIGWSNVLDYIGRGEFHEMAQECSVEGETIHYGYSMNWPTVVFGTCLFDYGGEENSEWKKEVMKRSNRAQKNHFCELGWESYFRFPLPQNPLNTVARVLELIHVETWVDYFLSTYPNGQFCRGGSEYCYGITSPLSVTGEGTVYLSWTYDRIEPRDLLTFLSHYKRREL